MKVIIFGCSGMLGHMVADYLYQHRHQYDNLTFTVKDEKVGKFQKRWPEANVTAFAACGDSMISLLKNQDYAINCIGMINKRIDESNEYLVREAKLTNTTFPLLLSSTGGITNTKIIHLSTDCVFSGQRGGYSELDKPDAADVYGTTKLNGEASNENMKIIRCSIIGPELDTQTGLLEWFLSKKDGDTINAYRNHYWNGITTLIFAIFCHTIITHNINIPHLFHFTPAAPISKATLLENFKKIYHKEQININFVNAPETINRTLKTIYPELNEKLWRLMGYEKIPSITRLIQELQQTVI